MKLVSVDDLMPRMIAAEDVYAPGPKNSPIIRCGTTLNKAIIATLKQRLVSSVLISEQISPPQEDSAASQQIIVSAHGSQIQKPPPLVTPEMRDDAIRTLQEIFEMLSAHDNFLDSHIPEIFSHVDEIVAGLVSSLSSDKASIVNIQNLKSPDDYIYHHSLSVAVLSVAIGEHMGLENPCLLELCKCALLHDIGKSVVPIEIIYKPARLSHNELSIMKNHALAGYQYLLENIIGNSDIWQGVLHHHERIDGHGYPYGFKGGEIPIFSRIIAVADVYDALTSNRPYRDSMQPAEALEYIMGGIDTSFDYNVVKSFVRKLELYPIGSYLLLSNKKIGVVVNNEFQMRPVVQLVDTGESLDLATDHSCLNIMIERILPDEQFILG